MMKKTKHTVKGLMRNVYGTPHPAATSLFRDLLADNVAEHNALLLANKQYWFQPEVATSYSRHEKDPRVVAIYLPQFHPFQENDQAWGKGFTEWTNVTASYARFVGQQQPVLPSDLGFYDLRLPAIMRQQIDLAKKYGVYGFQFYYYWFSGKKVMELPVNTLLKHKDWDFHFSICWANENWTRKWDGGDKEIIFEQKDLPDDPINFIKDVSHILNDSRYILEDGKPILTVYRVELLSDPARYVSIWREYFKQEFGKELWLIGHSYDASVDPKTFGFDATMDFTPIGSLQPTLKPWVDNRKYLTDSIFSNNKLLDETWRGNVVDFRFIAKQEIANLPNNLVDYKTVSPSWSNEARRKGNDSYTFANSSPEIFAQWLDEIINFETTVKKRTAPLVLINAWNEWAEGAMVEPSMHLGHSSLLRIAEVVSRYSFEPQNKESFPGFGINRSKKARLAVVIHLHYVEMWPNFAEKLARIDTPFDLFVSVPYEHSSIYLETIGEMHLQTTIIPVPNRGRDVLPFIVVATRLRGQGYEYILKVHSKKSLHRTDGNDWLSDVLSKLLPHSGVSSIIHTLKDSSTGAIGPEGHTVALSRHAGGNRRTISKLVEDMTGKGYSKVVKNEESNPFFGATMFWCRADFLNPLLDLYLMPSDFDQELGQIDSTTAHALERVFGMILHRVGGRRMYTVSQDGEIRRVSQSPVNEKYTYAE
jgi:lipopolysaccharide biosynthesis protein